MTRVNCGVACVHNKDSVCTLNAVLIMFDEDTGETFCEDYREAEAPR